MAQLDVTVKETGISQTDAKLNKLAQTADRTEASANRVGKSFGKIPFGQIGYQVQDLTTQLQMGTSAFVAIGQQGSQLAGAFGPGGAVIGAVIALGSAIAGLAFNAANAEADLTALEAAGRRLADLNLDTLVRLNDAQRDLADPANKQRYKELGDEILSLTQKYENQSLATQALRENLQKITSDGPDWLTSTAEYNAAVADASAKLNESLAAEAAIRSQVNGIQKQQDALYQGEIDKKRELDKENRKTEKTVVSPDKFAAKQAERDARALEASKKAALTARNERIAIAKKEREQIEAIEQGKRELAASVDPMAALEQERAARLEVIAKYDSLENANHQAAIDARKAADLQYEEGLNYAREERFRNESQANEFLMDSLDSLSYAASNAVSGLITGTMSASDALRNLASTIIDSAVSALVDMGVQYLKNMIIGETASAAAVATASATGTAMAAAYAPAAAMASLASFGANAAPAMAGISSTVATTQGLSLLSGRMQGGQVAAGDVRMVGERGPELVQFGRSGMVTPNSALGGATTTQQVVNVHNYAGTAVSTQQNSDGSTDIFIRKDELADLLASQAGNPNSKMNRAQGGVYERRRA